ncbi:alpha/beta hydrolase [Nocardia sp. NPDC050406]|uniref:alpha/beta hydrolase n=1 Tax=Nocardia sp. NPDC050406 TaxID=3364318 RepID=UPI0037B079FC
MARSVGDFVRRLGIGLAGVVLLGVFLPGCVRETITPRDFYPAALARFYTQVPRWGSCLSMSEREDRLSSAAQCARISVPLDYDQPDGRTILLAVARKPATGPDRIGSLLMNPGGPGVRGIPLVGTADGTDLARQFDQVGWDPRGVGASEPRIDCGADDEAGGDSLTVAEWRPHHEQQWRDYAAECVRGSGADLLAHIGTRETVRDMDVLRAVLGDKRLTYLGYSYGTRYGYAYAERYPHRVRAMVLDGAMDPDADRYTESLEEAQASQRTFDAFIGWCVRQQNCALGGDPAQALARFHVLAQPLVFEPLPSRADPDRALYYDDVLDAVENALYHWRNWTDLNLALSALRDGDPDPILRQSESDSGRQNDSDNSEAAKTAVLCADMPAITDYAVLDRLSAEIRRVAPLYDDGAPEFPAPMGECAFWPVPPTSQPHELAIANLPTVLVVSTTNDPVTPHGAGIDLARQLRAVLLTFEGNQHAVALSGESPCVDTKVVAYLATLALPPAETRCV